MRGGAANAAVRCLALVGAAALVTGGVWLWGRRPWRAAAEVNGATLTAGEMEMRAEALLDEAVKVDRIAVPEGRRGEALAHFRREAVKSWIMKEIMLAEAVAKGVEALPGDEQAALARMAPLLRSRNMTAEEYFKAGPMPEEMRRRDFREGVLVNKYTEREILDKIAVSAEAIDKRQNELKKYALATGKPGEKSKVKTDRRTAMEMLRAEAFRAEFRKKFLELFAKAKVRSPEYPELERPEGVMKAKEKKQ